MIYRRTSLTPMDSYEIDGILLKALAAINSPAKLKGADKALTDLVKRSRYYEQMYNQRRSPRGYQNWNKYVTRAIMFAAEFAPDELIAKTIAADPLAAMSLRIFNHVLESDAPVRYITAELCKAFLATKVPEKLTPPPAPFPGVHLLLPEGLLFDEEGCPVLTMQISNNEALAPLLHIGRFALGTPYAHIPGISINVCSESGANYSRTHFWNPARWGEIKNPSRTAPWLKCDEAGIEILDNKVLHIAVSAWLAMIYRPDLVSIGYSPGMSSGVRGFGPKGRKVPQAPTWLGRSYCRPAAMTLERKGSTEGPQVRPHWRTGHHREQAYGVGRKQRKVLWIEPIYVNAHAQPASPVLTLALK